MRGLQFAVNATKTAKSLYRESSNATDITTDAGKTIEAQTLLHTVRSLHALKISTDAIETLEAVQSLRPLNSSLNAIQAMNTVQSFQSLEIVVYATETRD